MGELKHFGGLLAAALLVACFVLGFFAVNPWWLLPVALLSSCIYAGMIRPGAPSVLSRGMGRAGAIGWIFITQLFAVGLTYGVGRLIGIPF